MWRNGWSCTKGCELKTVTIREWYAWNWNYEGVVFTYSDKTPDISKHGSTKLIQGRGQVHWERNWQNGVVYTDNEITKKCNMCSVGRNDRED